MSEDEQPSPGAFNPGAASPAFDKAMHYLDRKVSRAIREFGLLADGDRVLVALSGGKDSLTLLHALLRRRRWRPEHYEIVACHVRGGMCGGACSLEELLAGYCADLEVPFRVVEQELGEPPPGGRERSPCFVCSWHRRKALFRVAREEGCNLVAFGHHKDDLAETLLLNLLWQGRHESMLPRQPLFEGELTIIRPLVLVDERDIGRVARLGDLPAHVCPCPYGQTSKREVAGEIIRIVREAGCGGVTNNLLRSALAGRTVEGHAPKGNRPPAT